MTSKVLVRNKINDGLDDGDLINDIGAISGTLYLDKSKSFSTALRNQPKSMDKANASMPNLKSKHYDPSLKDKKSIWNWKPLKALSHVRNRRFSCGFTLEVHTVEGLPSELNGLSLSIHWKRREGEKMTRPVKVVEGVAEFEEKLIYTCSVYGSRSGPRHSAKYEAKHFSLYAVVHGNPKCDLGKHRVDLTKLLPPTLEELEGEKSSGTWTTSFKLLGNTSSAVMNVTFGYVVLGDSVAPNNKNVLKLLESKSAGRSNTKSTPGDGNSSIQCSGGSPSHQEPSITSQCVNDVNVLLENSPATMSEFASSINTLYQKLDDEKSNPLMDDKGDTAASTDDGEPVKSAFGSPLDLYIVISGDENEHAELSVADKGLESLERKVGLNQNCAKCVDEPVVESPDLALSYSHIQGDSQAESHLTRDGIVDDLSSEQEEICTKESILEDLESVLGHVAHLEKEALDTPEDESDISEWENEIDDKLGGITQSKLNNHVESVINPEEEAFDTPEAKSESSYTGIEVEDKPKGITQQNLDEVLDSVADEFLNMIGIGESPISFSSITEPESPRERLLREFEKETECSLFGFDVDEEVVADFEEEDAMDCNYHAPAVSSWEELSQASDILPITEPESPEIRAKVVTEYPKIRAKVMEDVGTESVMQDWSFDEKAFEGSPANCDGGGSIPTDPSPKVAVEEPSPLPPLGEGLGPFIQTKTGGFLRSMNPALFNHAKGGGTLIMQVSSPVVVPAQLGSGLMEILQNLASLGLEHLSMQANKLIPLEEISGKTMQQLVWEAANMEPCKRREVVQDVPGDGHCISTEKQRAEGDFAGQKSKKLKSKYAADEVDREYVSLEDLAPLAMDKIEALSIEGLRIQSGMAEDEAPYNITARSSVKLSTLGRRRASSFRPVGLEGAVGLQLLNIKDNGADHVDGLMGLSLTLEEWMKLDSGDIGEEEQLSTRTSKLLAAHQANSTDLNFLKMKKQGKASGRRYGLLGNNFTVALMVQLRDPVRNYESVGMPMLALIQVERVFLPPRLKLYRTISGAEDCDDEDEPESANNEDAKVEFNEEELIPHYKVNQVHVGGFKTEPGQRRSWGSPAQQQSGSRWLLANGMGKGNNNHTFLTPKVTSRSSSLPATATLQPGDALWSISARIQGDGSKGQELATLNSHLRNPDIILPNETIKLW